MTIASISTAGDIINRVAVEVGHTPVVDPFADTSPEFVKLRYLIDIAGKELALAYPWEFLLKTHRIVTALGDDGLFDLPADFYYMINQTGWERANNRPLGGPVSPQDWAYIKGSQLVNTSIYITFRISGGKFLVHPDPPPEGLDINFEYVSTRWVQKQTTPVTYAKQVTEAADRPLYDDTLMSRYLKLKYLEATGFDTTKAQDDFTQLFSFITGRDKGAPVLNMGGRRMPRFLGYDNLPDTNYGL